MINQRKVSRQRMNVRNVRRVSGSMSSYSSASCGLTIPLNIPNRSETPVKYGLVEGL